MLSPRFQHWQETRREGRHKTKRERRRGTREERGQTRQKKEDEVQEEKDDKEQEEKGDKEQECKEVKYEEKVDQGVKRQEEETEKEERDMNRKRKKEKRLGAQRKKWKSKMKTIQFLTLSEKREKNKIDKRKQQTTFDLDHLLNLAWTLFISRSTYEKISIANYTLKVMLFCW